MKGVGFARNDSAVLWIEQAVAQFFFSIEGEVILALHGIRENRYVKGRMRTDREVHGFLRFVYNFPGDGQITFVKCMRDVELEDIWPVFESFFGGFQQMCNGCIGLVRADKFHIAGKSVLTGSIRSAIDQTVVFIIASDIRKENRSMAFPVGRIGIPEYLAVVCLIVDL